ncbi:uncharacterized protein METZ01_LOCUS203717 [marine metagenome]|uniref:Uncharacterized protein n=1 Tax=marine metagenome TaxID=408172 RepID=A0A382ELU6_9ZZZZ
MLRWSKVFESRGKFTTESTEATELIDLLTWSL